MKIISLSDSHRKHREIEMPEDKDIDLLIHTGDITSNGELETIKDFSAWLKELPYQKKLIIGGNHDKCFEVRDKTHAKSIKNREVAIQMITDAGGTYLEHESIIVDGVKMFFSPFQPFFCNWSFNVQRGKDLAEKWATIPNDVQLLAIHGPPYGILDEVEEFLNTENVGDLDLLNRIEELKELKTVIFGHIHYDKPKEPVIKNGITFINAAICDNRYRVAHKPIVFEI